MRFMIMRKADPEAESGVPPSDEVVAAMSRYLEEQMAMGILRSMEGLHPSSQGARVRFSAGKPTITDGPFTETKELIAGFAIIEVPSKQEAIAWVTRWPPPCDDGNSEIEIRRVYEEEDFGGAIAPEPSAAEDRMRQQPER